LRGTEGNRGFLAALRAGGPGLDLGVVITLSRRRRSGSQYGHPFGLTGLAALGLILELFVVKEKLFPGGEDEIGAAIDTLQYLVLKFH